MAKSFALKIVTPEKLFYEGEVEMVIVKATTGEEGFMADHTWACKLLVPGNIRFKEADTSEFKSATVTGGFVDVRGDALVYADSAEWKDEADGNQANR